MFPLGVVAYPSVGASTTPLGEESSLWKGRKPFRLRKALSNRKRRPQQSASSLLRHPKRLSTDYSPASSQPSLAPSSSHSASSTRPKHVPIVIPHYVPILAPCSPSSPTQLSSSRTSTIASSGCPSLSSFPHPGRRSFGDCPGFRARHVEIVIPDWALPVQRFSSSPIELPFDFPLAKPPSCKDWSPIPVEMARQTPNASRSNTIDSQTSAPSPSQLYSSQFGSAPGAYMSSVNNSQTSLHQQDEQDAAVDYAQMTRTPGSGVAASPALHQTAGLSTPTGSTSGLSGLVCNVHRTTGREPHPLVGATTTIIGDKLYVFGGRRLSRTRPQLTADLYELDLIKRHWSKIYTKGDIPPPRYFHSMCALGDTKLVCYAGMSPAAPQPGQPPPSQLPNGADTQPEVVVMPDIHIYDIPTRTWMRVATPEAPQGRYAHCATILPSTGVFPSTSATLSAIRHNPSSTNPNQGSIGVQLDGEGGAEMVVVGGQDSGNNYIEQISVFNFRNFRWTSTSTLNRSCGAYRSVVAPLTTMDPERIGTGGRKGSESKALDDDTYARGEMDGPSMLIYSNYNFLDVRLELQIRLPDGSLIEKPVQGTSSPPGLRFPNGGVINNHFVVSGTFRNSSRHEYALWALDLRNLSWSRIEAGGNLFSQGSWNRGILWNRRNCYVILGNRRRNLAEDYDHRRMNFSNMCVVELEAFGLYDNPRKLAPSSGYLSVSAPRQVDKVDVHAGGRRLSHAAAELGQMALGMRELADMDFLAINGERIPVNSHLIARRWGPYFNQLLRESSGSPEESDASTLRPPVHPSRNSSITITPSVRTYATASSSLTTNTITTTTSANSAALGPPDPTNNPPAHRSRTLFLPHTHLTLQALIHFLYTSSLPPKDSRLSSPQILCSLLQLARPYHIDGLLEAIIERLHVVLDGRNTAAIFNAAAMAAGGGSGVAFLGVNGVGGETTTNGFDHAGPSASGALGTDPSVRSLDPALRALRINTDLHEGTPANPEDEINSATSTSTTASESGLGPDTEIWAGDVSAVVGLQKRGLRGLMEGRRQREMGRGAGSRRRDDSVSRAGGDGVGLGLTGPSS